MWGNWEVAALTEWLKTYNSSRQANKRIGFYGLDVYSLWESMEVLVDYLSVNDPHAAELAKKAVHCFEPYGEDGQLYAMHGAKLPDSCKDAVVSLLHEIRTKARNYNHDPEATLNTEQNAYVAVNAEAYYRNMVGFDDKTWNLRDKHMVETLHRILNFHGTESKAIVWEHNTHIGDARYTDMAAAGMINVGQLLRHDLGEHNVVAVGFSSYQGTVIAGKQWGSAMEVMHMPPARRESIEGALHNQSPVNRMLIFGPSEENEEDLNVVQHRAIGVVYHPEHEEYGNYVPTVIQRRYDAFIYLDQTRALHPLAIEPDLNKTPETYPFSF
jgi:erythromycin esterase-like protein